MFFDNTTLKKIMLVVRQAGDAIIETYDNNTVFKLKEDDTPLTEVDLLSHSIITQGLTAITPDINILSEESEFTHFKERKTWEEYWLIDPLDGTRGFIDKTDDFCICLSYIKNNEPVFGLIYAPLLNTYYIANNPGTAYKVKDDMWQQIFAKKPTPQSPLKVIVGKYSVNKKSVLQHLHGILDGKEYELHGVGSALKFCFIAEGKYDYYPALGICSEWDTAAGSFILRAAGGYVVDFSNNQLKYNTKNDLISPIFFASGDFKLSRND
jgi:3'(2'), 5'-bisphosphate nucleotidase